jgi:hypothetical protein
MHNNDVNEAQKLFRFARLVKVGGVFALAAKGFKAYSKVAENKVGFVRYINKGM